MLATYWLAVGCIQKLRAFLVIVLTLNLRDPKGGLAYGIL